ncbi:MAG: NAD(P)/FAD-dependent oxidoreductase [Micavibrio aeruginosavorus]|nr:NAD(P)/FAD-dependent oxidoreductase [Micavibrio aeruginosavorus]
MSQSFDVIIIGAGAAGLICAAAAVQRGRTVMVLDHARKIAEKIRISGGGRCNFTNLHCAPDRFISANPHFCKSALSRYTPQDFIALVDRHGIAWHEKTLGQLFCDGSAQQIIDMLLKECDGAAIQPGTEIRRVEKHASRFVLETAQGNFDCESLVIATGGPSIPKIGASGFGYDIARQFGLNVIAPRAGLVPLTFQPDLLAMTRDLSGVSVDSVVVSCGKVAFREALLFTHRGLSGPAILQISSYWNPGDEIVVNLCPDIDTFEFLRASRRSGAKKKLHTVLGGILPQRLADRIAAQHALDGAMADLSDNALKAVVASVNAWRVKPGGSEGFRTAEVTLGGVDTRELSSRTFEAGKIPGLYFIGEVIDVTGWLGGYNFQWAWSSGWCAGQDV